MNTSNARYPVLFVYLLLAIVVAACFWQVRNFDFVNYDDNEYVYENAHVLGGLTHDGFISAFTSAPAYGNWLPLTWLSFMLDCQLFGPNPGLIHLVNFLLHLVNTLLLFAILKKMTGSIWPSAFVAAAFALHPMHVESVAWITERKDVLSGLFFLLTLAAYTSYVRRPSIYRYLATLVLFGLGLLAKPMLVTLPFVLLLLDYWPLNRFEPQMAKASGRQAGKSVPASDGCKVLYRTIIEKVPFFALSAISSVITFLAQRGSGAVVDFNSLPFWTRAANAILSYIRYVGKMFWPHDLTVLYPLDPHSVQFWHVVPCALLLLIISVFVLRFGRKQRYLIVGWFWFLGTLVPVIGVIQSGAQSFADRYTYIPYIGLFIMIAWGLPQLVSRWPYRKIALGISAAMVLTALGICSYRQVSYWNNSVSLFSHSLEVSQNNYLAHYCLGEDFRRHGNASAAIEHYKKALEIRPDYPHAVLALGSAFADHGDLDRAIECFQKTLQLRSASVYARAYANYNLGIALREKGNLAESLAHFQQAVQLKPDFAEARFKLAGALIQQGALDEGVDQFYTVCRLKPGWPDSMNNFAWYTATHPELKRRDVNEAIRLAARACALTNYKNPAFVGTLAAAYAAAGRFAEAIDTANMALRLADAASQIQIKKVIQYHLSLYNQGKSYTEYGPKPISDSNRP